MNYACIFLPYFYNFRERYILLCYNADKYSLLSELNTFFYCYILCYYINLISSNTTRMFLPKTQEC